MTRVTCKIKDVISEVKSGDWGKGSPTENYTTEVLCVRGADIPELCKGNVGKMPQRFIHNKKATSKILSANNLIIEISGGSPTQSTGRIALISDKILSRYSKPLICSNFCKAITATGIQPEYLFNYWLYLYNKDAMFPYENGTTGIKNLDFNSFIQEQDISIPDIKTQQKIVSILSSIDEKIETNKRINDNLEEQAKALFNHYFIQNTENLGEWQDGVLTDIAQYLNGLAMQKYPAMPNEAGLPVLKIKELGQGQCDTNSDRCSSLIKPEYIISDGTIIFSWSGTLLVDIWCGGKCGLNQHLFKVSSAKYPQWVVFYWTKHHLNKFIRIAKDKAVTMGHIKRCDLEISKVKIPSKQALVNLDKLFSPIFNRMVTCRIENRKLSSLRDTLLPKLMSGEISVEEVSLD